MPKNIVICCDGTGERFFGPQPSNVVKLYQALTKDGGQVTYYHSGIGTAAAPGARGWIERQWTRLLGLAFGIGLTDHIADAYSFLIREYQPGDQVFLFGFSRGAYTVRALSGLLHLAGLLKQGSEGNVPKVVRMISGTRPDFNQAAQVKAALAQACPVRFLGVWDTVSSVGWIYNAVHFPYTRAEHNPDLKAARHAVSIDERRAFFRENLIGPPAGATQDVKEVWFAGVHEDVGGGVPEAEAGLAQVTLRWMICEAEGAGVRVDATTRAALLGGSPPNVPPNPTTKFIHRSLTGLWLLCEVWPKVVHVRGADGRWHARIRLNLDRRRQVPSGSFIHQSVQLRLADPAVHYHPGTIPTDTRVDAKC